MAEDRPVKKDDTESVDRAQSMPPSQISEEPTVERLSISVTWERSPARDPARASKAGAADGSRNSSGAGNNGESGASPGSSKPDWSQDWSHGQMAHKPAGADEEEDLSDEEVEADLVLLDDAFLKRTFKEVHFPASKELCLRFVDQEQDFAYGLDRTVNLHHVITHLEPEEFPTRRDLLKAIKDRIHHHALPRAGS